MTKSSPQWRRTALVGLALAAAALCGMAVGQERATHASPLRGMVAGQEGATHASPLPGIARSGLHSSGASPAPQPTADSLRLDSSYAIASCAPNDGPAVTLYLGGTVADSGLAQRVDAPFVEISIWQGWSTLRGQAFVLEHSHGNGYASYCPTDKTCERLDFVRVSFDAVSDNLLRGRAEFTVRGNRMLKLFDARRLDIRMMCG